MATREEYRKQGYTDAQIDSAISAKTPQNASPWLPAGSPVPENAQTMAGWAVSGTFVAPAVQPVAQSQADFNARQAAFDAQNPVGTKIENLDKVQTQGEIDAASNAQTANLQTSAPVVAPIVTPPQAIEPVKTEGFTPKTPVERRDTLGKLSDVPKTASEMEKERLDLENAKSASGQQMLKNVSVMAQETPEILSDRKTFEDMTSFATKPESERRVLEAYWQSKNAPKSESDYFKLLASGQDVFNRNLKTTPEYLRAKTKSDKFKALRQMDSNSMYSELVAGNVPTEFRELLSQSPAFAEANKRFYQKLSTDNINDSTRAIGSAISGTKYSPEDKLESLSERFVSTAPSKTYSELFRSKISSNENIRGLSTTLSAKNEELKKLTEARNNIVKEVKRNFPGMPLALQISYAARQAEPINEQINTMEYEAERISSDLKFETYVANQEFQAESKDLELMNSIGKENRDRSFQKELAIFQNELKNQGIETQIIKDEATGKQALINSKTGAVISSYDTGAKPGSGTTFQQIKQTDELGRETVVGYFDPTTGKSTYYGAGIAHSGTTNIGTNVPVSVNASWTATPDSLIKKWEWFRDKAYQDQAGVWTVWYGFTNVNGKPVKQGDTMDINTANAQFDEKVGKYTNFKNFVKVPLSESQQAALNSFEYNLGSGIWEKDAMPIIDKINSWDLEWAASEMKKYVYAGWKVSRGLQNRRNEEAKLLASSESNGTWFDEKKSSLYENVLKWDAKTLNAKGYTTPESRSAITQEAIAWASSGGETAKTKSEREKASRDAVIDRIDKFNAGQTSKDYKLGKPNIDKVMKNAEADTAASDIALIFGFMKQQDPQSTVREGEFATAQNSGGVPDAVRNAYNKAMSGQRLQPAQREDFVKTSISAFKSQLSAYNEEIRNAKQIAESLGIDTKAFPKEETFVRSFKDGTAIEYDWLGKYRYKGKDSKWSGWNNEGTPIAGELSNKPSALERAKALRNK